MMPEEPITLLEEILRSPTHFKGARSKRVDGHITVVPYTAKRLNDDLLKRIRDAVKNPDDAA